TRFWWVLRYYGHANARVLNGGWNRWLTEGRPVTFHQENPPPPAREPFHAHPDPSWYATLNQLKAEQANPECQILDVRSDGGRVGTNDRGNKRAGRVPNARHLEWLRFVSTDDRRTFLPPADLERLLADAGIDHDHPVITYCQGGIRAAHAAFVLTLLGHD